MSIKWFELGPEEREEAAKKLAEALRREERVALAFLFGSFLEGVFRDVDVAVYISGEVDLLDAAAYAEELSSRLTALVGLPVDVVVLNFAPTWLRRRAFSGKELVVKDELLYAALWANALDEELGLTAFSK
ncbi:MAG: nucleotidyltransferase domain-containing protein [Pyrobaculum sp.]|jgi:predicted nucleotidyltransferase